MIPLEVIHLEKTYYALGKEKTVQALKGISFEVQSAEIFGLLGPNGAGKTTTLAAITTLEEPSAGKVKVFGHCVKADPIEAKKRLGVVHQEVINSGFFTVEEILDFQSGFYGIRKNRERIHFLLNKLSLYEHRQKKVKQLSGGMKRRLMIAKALVHSPKLLLLDEPTAGVDIGLRETLWDFVRELKKEGVSILLTTHYLEEAEMMCDRVAIINHGRIECLGPTKEIISRFTQKTITLVLAQEHQFTSSYLSQSNGKQFTFVVPTEMQLGQFFQEVQVPVAQIVDVKIEEGSLEDAFVRVLKKQPGVQP